MIDQICVVLHTYVQGREDQLFSELEARYGPAQKPAPAASAPSKGRAAKVAAPRMTVGSRI